MSSENLSQHDQPLQGRRIHPALYFEDNFASVGIVDNAGEFWVMTSDRQIFSLDQQDLLLETSPLAYRGIANRWNVDDLNDWLANDQYPSVGETVTWIKEVIAHFCELEYVEQASLIACWIMGTYFHQLFPAFPRLHLHGERGSGKTKILTLIAALAFNGLLRLNPTPATLFRLVHSLRPTLCLDETETLAGHEKVDLLSVVNAGYKRGAQVDRCVGDHHELRSFDVYSPLALGGISGLNSVTEDRALTVITKRGKHRNQMNAEVDCDDPYFQAIRSFCYRLTLSRFEEVRQARKELGTPDWLSGRYRELYVPLLSIAASADREGGAGMVTDLLTLAQYELPQRTGRSFETEALMDVLRSMIAKTDPLAARPGHVAFLLEDGLGARVTPERVGQMLRRLGLERCRDSKGTYYLVTSARLAELDGET